MGSFVRWVEASHFFARPRAAVVNCLNTADQFMAYTFSSCRQSAAGTCSVPDITTWSGDACVCSTLNGYESKFSACIYDTPYSSCVNPSAAKELAQWSSGHCTKSSSPSPFGGSPTTATVTVTFTPNPPATVTVEPSSKIPDPLPPSSKEQNPGPSSEQPQPTEPPRTSIAQTPFFTPEVSSSLVPVPSSAPAPPAVQSSEAPKSEDPPETPMSTPSEVPQPSLVPVSVAPRPSSQATSAGAPSSVLRIAVPRWTGTGNLLQGYCATPAYTIVDGPTAYWAPVVGCVSDRPDCCPFDVPRAGPNPTAAALALINGAMLAAETSAAIEGHTDAFPSAIASAQATLERCPNDYHSIGNGCCPSNYFPWSTSFGGQIPCYSTLAAALTPPPIPESLLPTGTPETASAKPTSAIVNVVYAMQYPVKDAPPPKPALSTNVRIGIGAGAAGVALVVGSLISLLIWRHRSHKRDRAAFEGMSGMGSTRQSVTASHSGVKEWRSRVPSPPPSKFHEGLEPTLPNLETIQQQPYPAQWRPGQRAVSPPVPSIPSPSLQDRYSEADSQQALYTRYSSPVSGSDGGYSTTNRSELQSGEFIMQRQELQGVPEEHYSPAQPVPAPMTNAYVQSWNGQEGAGHGYYGGQGTFHEAPAGRSTPRV